MVALLAREGPLSPVGALAQAEALEREARQGPAGAWVREERRAPAALHREPVAVTQRAGDRQAPAAREQRDEPGLEVPGLAVWEPVDEPGLEAPGLVAGEPADESGLEARGLADARGLAAPRWAVLGVSAPTPNA